MSDALWTSAEIAAATGGRPVGAPFVTGGIDIDSRDVVPGDLFVALAGERNGHAFVPAALAAGASGVLVSQPTDGPAIQVSDTLAALRDLGVAARERAPAARRGAVTGSVGKTSVTQAVLAGLRLAGPAHGSVKSFNNHIGVPLTLGRMPAGTARAVFEMGMNHAGEIAPLSRLVRPHAVAITNVEAVHTENFADGEAGVARAKAEIFSGMESGGQAILNADSRWVGELTRAARASGAAPRTFGADGDARLVCFTLTCRGAEVEAVIDGAPVAYTLRQSAPHWGPMSLAALLLMRALDVDLDIATRALSRFEPLQGRGAVRRVEAPGGAFTVIDESYNASPVSVTAALAALGARHVTGRRLAVLTDMLELGPDSAARHAALAGAVVDAKVDLVFCAGPLMRHLFDALPAQRRGAWAPDAASLAPNLLAAIAPGDAIMVKGSKASKASTLAEALLAREAA